MGARERENTHTHIKYAEEAKAISEMDRCSTMFMIRIRFKIAILCQNIHAHTTIIRTSKQMVRVTEWFFLAIFDLLTNNLSIS